LRREQLKTAGVYHYKTAEQGAATSVLVATSPSSKASKAATSRTATRRRSVDPASAERTGSGVAPYAVDPTNAERLWELSLGTLSWFGSANAEARSVGGRSRWAIAASRNPQGSGGREPRSPLAAMPSTLIAGILPLETHAPRFRRRE
jgi:hypothetical protein